MTGLCTGLDTVAIAQDKWRQRVNPDAHITARTAVSDRHLTRGRAVAAGEIPNVGDVGRTLWCGAAAIPYTCTGVAVGAGTIVRSDALFVAVVIIVQTGITLASTIAVAVAIGHASTHGAASIV